MVIGKQINRYYLRFAHLLLLGLAALVMVDYLTLIVPNLYQKVINGINLGYVEQDGVQTPFDMAFLLDQVCVPMLIVILGMVFGRFLWRVSLFTAAIRVETDLRNRMFDRAKNLSREYYQVNKVGNLKNLLEFLYALLVLYLEQFVNNLRRHCIIFVFLSQCNAYYSAVLLRNNIE